MEIFTADKKFDPQIVAALVRVLGDKDFNVRSVVNLFTVTIAQGVPCCFHGIFILE